MRTIAIFSTSGGGGKTTTTANLAAALAERGQRVLMVDLDPCGDLLRAFGRSPRTALSAPREDKPTDDADNTQNDDEDLSRRIQPTELAGVFMLGASADLGSEQGPLRADPDAEGRLRRLLSGPCRGRWDFLLFDCGSGANHLSAAALAIADEHIAPVEASPISLGSLSGTLLFANGVRNRQSPELEPTRILVSRTTAELAVRKTIDALRERFGDRVLATEIPHSRPLVEGSAHLEPVLCYEPDDPAAAAYRELASELFAIQHAGRGPTRAPVERRATTIRVSDKTTRAEDYLRMLDCAALARAELEPRRSSPTSLPHAPARHASMQCPRMLLTDERGLKAAAAAAEAARGVPQGPAPEPARSGRPKAGPAREWKLSARLDRDLLAELYGAADQLAGNRATVSSMVEEALRLYLPLLRGQHNGGQPFRHRGPKARAPERKPLLDTPPTG